MFRPRIIPVLLLRNNALVKSTRFKHYRYLGDPLNAVRIFNELKVDELIFLDTQATVKQNLVSLDLIRSIGEEANMPFAVGGGIQNLKDIKELIAAGAEKVVICSAALDENFIRQACDNFGSSTISVCIDVGLNWRGRERTFIRNGKKITPFSPESLAQSMEKNGVGELIIQSIAKDGTMNGYDIDLTRRIASATSLPVVALGGAGNLEHLRAAHVIGGANAAAAGSMFIYHTRKKGVLLNYPVSRTVYK